MTSNLAIYIHQTMWVLFVGAAILYSILALDELAVDIIYWLDYFWQKTAKKRSKSTLLDELNAVPEKRIAITVACWHEHEVIGNMLSHNIPLLDYSNYDFFVGVYPNDLPTIKAVQEVAKKFTNVHCVINSRPGPTKKSDNLNAVYHAILAKEQTEDIQYDIFLLHDAEDILHPLELKIHNKAIGKYDMVQTPVLPLAVPLKHFTHWMYNDEFAEFHTKNIIARHLYGGFIPSAGVGTAFSRHCLNILARIHKGRPFLEESLTEDYDTALRLQALGYKAGFFCYPAQNTDKERQAELATGVKNRWIATRSLFPTSYRAAVRQRTRWLMGTVLQEWADRGWLGSWKIRFNLAQDRKAIFSNFINGLAYFIFGYWLSDFIFHFSPYQLNELIHQHHWVKLLLIISIITMLMRLLQRAVSVYRVYGIAPALLSIPRYFYANVLNTHVSFNALIKFIKYTLFNKTLVWEKTNNRFIKRQ